MAAPNQMLGHQLGRLHVIRTNNVDLVEIAGAGGKHQRRLGFSGFDPQFCGPVDRTGNHHAVDALRHQRFKTLEHLLAAVAPLGQKDHFPLRLEGGG